MKKFLKKFSPLHSHLSTSSGFTLVELILVIVIIAIISTVVLFAFNPFEQIRKANDSRRKTDLEQIQRGLELYYHDFGAYPTSSADYKISANSVKVNWGSPWQPYMVKLPADPVSTNMYVYYSPPSSGGQSYYIYSSLQRGSKDAQSCNAGNACASLSQSGFPASTACGGTCNYGVSSPNVSP